MAVFGASPHPYLTLTLTLSLTITITLTITLTLTITITTTITLATLSTAQNKKMMYRLTHTRVRVFRAERMACHLGLFADATYCVMSLYDIYVYV